MTGLIMLLAKYLPLEVTYGKYLPEENLLLTEKVLTGQIEKLCISQRSFSNFMRNAQYISQFIQEIYAFDLKVIYT